MAYQFTDENRWKADIRAGDTSAYKYAFDFFYSDLCIYTTNFTSDPQVAEDIVQEIFINLWKNRESILISGSLKSYLYRSCYNRFIDSYRKKKKINKKLEELRYIGVQQAVEEDPWEEEQKIARLNAAIEKLPKKCKEVLLLSKLEGLKYQEIADQLGISVKTVEYQISTAYKQLRLSLQSPSEMDMDSPQSLKGFFLVLLGKF